MKENISLAINQMIMPNSSFEEFITLAKKLNVKAIEIRNDIATNLIEENKPNQIKKICEENSIEILTINALQKFNIWNEERSKELIELCDYASQAGIKAIVLVPLNDNSINNEKDQEKLLENSLNNIEKILQNYDLSCLVEPLGFKQSSLRKKSIAVNIIKSLDINKIKILHDTFHHSLSGEKDIYPDLTGLIHISGVSKDYIKNYVENTLTDDHRSIIDENDIIENVKQLNKFLNYDYKGFFSFEPFSNSLIQSDNIFESMKKSFDFIKSQVK